MNGPLPWRYRCSKCEKLVEVPDVTAHTEAHRAEPEWDGVLELTRVDRGNEREGES